MKYLLFLLAMALSSAVLAEDPDTTPVMTPDQLKHYPFPDTETSKPPKISDLSVSQQFVLSKDRRDVKGLVARHLGILDIHGDKSDLDTIQQLCDRHVLKDNQVREWQSVGVIFGDILANEFDLHWVSYADDAGVSTALQWKDTRNFVFPVTMFSKRIQFDEKIDVHAMYDKLASEIQAFKDYENKRPKM